MKKHKILILMIILMFNLFGCTKATITYQIDNKFNTSVTYYLLIDKNLLPSEQHINFHKIITTTASA